MPQYLRHLHVMYSPVKPGNGSAYIKAGNVILRQLKLPGSFIIMLEYDNITISI